MKKRALALAATIILVLTGCEISEPSEIPVMEDTSKQELVEQRVSFLGAGDNLIHNCVYWQGDDNAPGAEYDFKPMYKNVAEKIKSADIAYINQETILGGTEIGLSSYPLFNSPQEVGRDMKDLGFDVFSHATNHVFDKGEFGLKNTYSFYEKNPDITCIGLYKSGEDIIKIVEKNGIKIAFLNYTYTTNGLSLPQNSEYYVPIADFENNCDSMIKTVKTAKERADFVVCCLHWGNENSTRPSELQKNNAKLLADAGCDVIVGTHPHAIEPIEYIDDTLVVYSLGNFISAQNTPVNLLGGMIEFEFVKKGEECKVENAVFTPVITQFGNRFSNIEIIPFDEYSPSIAASHGVDVSYDYFKNVIDQTIPREFLAM